MSAQPQQPSVQAGRRLVPWDGDREVWVRRLGAADVDAAGDWLDVHLQGDYFFKRRHLRGVLTRGNSEGWGVEADGVLIGVLIIYQGTTLHNLYLAAEWRGQGLGAALVQMFQPTKIRAKTNMLAADPTGFYQRQGYEVESADPHRPWILNMALRGDRVAENVAPNAPGSTISTPPGTNHHPQRAAAAGVGNLSAEQMVAAAAAVRKLSDPELVALAEGFRLYRAWQTRQRLARERRLQREKDEAAAAAAGHLPPGATAAQAVKAAREQAAAKLSAMFEGGGAVAPHSE